MRRLLLGAAFALYATGLAAQTNDHNWRSWQWLDDAGSARSAGLGGASVALPDDAYGVVANPAAIGTLTKREVTAGVLARNSGTLPVGDSLEARTGIGFIGGAAKIGQSFAAGGYVTEPHDARITLNTTYAGGLDSGYLQMTVTDAGAALAWNAAPRLSVGIRLNVTHVRVQGLLEHRDGASSYASGTAAGQNQLAGDGGVLFQPSDALTLGASFVQGARWTAQRSAQGRVAVGGPGAPSPAGPANAQYQVSSPSRLSAGTSYRVSPKLLLVAQVDYVLLSRLKDTFQAFAPPFSAIEYKIDDGVDFRGGAEVSLPVGAVSVVLRGAVYSEAPRGIQFGGPSVLEAGTFAGVRRQTVGAAGASLVAGAFHIDLGGSFGGQRTTIAAGARVRF